MDKNQVGSSDEALDDPAGRVNSKPGHEQPPPRGLRIITYVMALYFFVAMFLALSIVHTRDVQFIPFIVFAIMCLATVWGLVGKTRWGRHWAVTTASLLILYSIFAIKSDTGLLVNSIVGLGIVLYFATERTPIEEASSGLKISTFENRSTKYQWEVPKMTDGEKQFDELRYNLELEKFRWEREKYYQEGGIINRHFGVIITSIISFAAIVVSCLQVIISWNNAKAQADNETLKNDRQFYFEVAKFLFDKQQEMTTEETDKITYLRDVVVSSFPNDVAIKIASGMQSAASVSKKDEVRKVWDDALHYLRYQAAHPVTK
jgi:hypothetical protein